MDGPFQLAEYLALKIRHDPHDVKGLVDVPAGDESEGGKGPDRDVVCSSIIFIAPDSDKLMRSSLRRHQWIYEHLR